MVIQATPVCVVMRLRNKNATILGRRTRSPLALPFALSYENNQNGQTLNLGESVVLQLTRSFLPYEEEELRLLLFITTGFLKNLG
jgi:hypothetical protein